MSDGASSSQESIEGLGVGQGNAIAPGVFDTTEELPGRFFFLSITRELFLGHVDLLKLFITYIIKSQVI